MSRSPDRDGFSLLCEDCADLSLTRHDVGRMRHVQAEKFGDRKNETVGKIRFSCTNNLDRQI
jgi:hypothetical protein